MTFKDLYKSANGNISGDRKLIDVVFEKAQEKPQEKPVFNFKYATLCAASLILVISLGVFPMLNKQTEKPNVQIAKKPPEGIVKVKEETNETNKEKKMIDANTTYVPEENPSENKSTKVSDNYQIETENKEVDIIAPEKEISIASLEDEEIEYDAMPENEEISSGGAGTFALAKLSGEADNFISKQMTLQQYLEYLGIENLNFNSSLPMGMNFDMPQHVSVLLNSQTNVIEDDSIQFVALDSDDPQKIFMLSTSTNKQEDFHYDEMTDINGISVKKHYDEMGINFYFEYNKACVTIQSHGVSEEDLDMFLNSFLK